MGTYNVSKIEGWLKDFTSAKDKFTNTYYSDYKNSYIRSCNDSAVIKMRNKLNQHYDRINRINKKIKDVWDDFLYDLKAIDNRLAGGKGSTNDSAVASKLSKLPTLKEYSATLKTRINSSSAVVGTVDKIGWSEDRTALENIDYVLDRTEATITVAGTSVIEGIGKFGEGIMDACAPIVTEAYCWYHLTYTEGFTEETAEEARQNSRDFVAKEHVKSAFEDAYSESLRERAYGFDTIRSVGNEIGEVVPAAVISMIPGVGQVLGPAVYGVAKSGNHIEENFQDENNGYLESILKGYAEGVFDGLFFAAGMKGDAVMKSAAKEIVKEGGKATLKKGGILFAKTIYECGCSVAQDGSNILIDSIFLDGPVQASDGSVIQNPSFLDKLNYCFEQSGGMKGMATSMMTATVLSSVSDAVDLRGIKNVDTNTALKNADINTSSTRKSMSNVNSKNIDITSKSNKSISGASKNATDINSNNVKKSVNDIKNKDINIKSKNKGNTFIGDKIGGSASDPDVLKKIDELRNSKVVNTSNSKNINVKSNNDVKVNPLSKEYDDLLKKTKEPWFIQAKEARDNGWAWNLNEVSEVDNIVKRMGELEGNLGIKNTGIPESKIYDYSGAKKEADELARKISKEPIPGFENIDTNSPEYQKALKEHYSKPSPSGKQDLSQFKKTKGNTFVGDKVGGSASDPDVLKKIDELRNSKVNNVNKSNEFRIIQDITGGAAADEKVLKQVGEILNFDNTKVKNIETLLQKKNLTSAEKTDIWLEYNKLVDKVTGSGDFENKLRLHSRGNFFEGSDQFAKDIEKIRIFEKKLGVPESSSIIPDNARPFEWTNDKLDIDKSGSTKRKPYYNYGGSASENQFLKDNAIKNTYKSFQTDNGIGVNISRKNDILTLAPLGVTEVDGKIIYISLYNGKTIYSGTDVISQYLNGDESLRKSIVDNFLNESRINKYLMTTDGYIGHFEIKNGVMQKKIFENFELKINEKANSYGIYLDDVRKSNMRADFGAGQHTTSNYISKIDSKGVHVYDNNRQAVKNTINSLKNKYNIDTNSVCDIIYNMDGNGAGACSYASRANAIFSKYKGRETDFMRDFGYPMYENINGQVALNSRTLVTDLYISSNLDRNIPGKISLFKTGNDGKIEVNPKISDGKFRKKNQVYMSNKGGINDDDMNLFFKRNGLSITHNSKQVPLNSIKSELVKGNQVHLGIYQDVNAPITLHNLDGGRDTITTSWSEGGGHALQVVGIQGDNIIVSSWGDKHSINISDLKSDNYVVYSTSIK